MSYSIYWYRPVEIPITDFSRIVSKFWAVKPFFGLQGIVLRGGDGFGRSRIDDDEICFNGDADHDLRYASFSLPRVFTPPYPNIRQDTQEDGLDFCFCKTQRMPYDLAVRAVLVIASAELPDFRLSNQEVMLEAMTWINQTNAIPRIRAETLSFSRGG